MRHSELRQDPVSGDWIVVAPRRGARPHEFEREGRRVLAPRRTCPFEIETGARTPESLLRYGNEKTWTVKVIENKFPAFAHRSVCPAFLTRGLYTVAEGAGHHNLLVTRSHTRNFSDLSPVHARLVFQAFRDRYLMFAEDKCVYYASFFQNWGPSAGASIYHPHYQMIAIPVIPPEVEHSFRGSAAYFRRHERCVHCDIIAYERRVKRRVIAENASAIALAPFASRAAFEMHVFPKTHSPFFEDSFDAHLLDVVHVLQNVLRALKRALRDPDYNFFIHTAPIRNKRRYHHYHWHIEVLPKLNIPAGFELGTGLNINPVDPDRAARMLRAACSS